VQYYKLRPITTLVVSLIIILISVNTSFTQEPVIATTTNYLNMRQGPSTEYDVIIRLELNESLVIIGRNVDGSWLNGTTMNGAYTGWVATSYLSLSEDTRISDLPTQPITQATINVAPETSSSEVQSEISTADNGITISAINVRNDDSTSGNIIGKLLIRTPVVIESRNSIGNWVIIHTVDTQVRGWVASRYINFDDGLTLTALPVVEELIVIPKIHDGRDPDEILIPPENYQPAINITDSVLHNVLAIYQRGQEMGNQSDSLIMIGESNTVPTAVYCTLGTGNYSLGQYPHFQRIIDRFNSTNSFCRAYESAQTGFNSSSVLDPYWSNPNYCQADESPIQCEIRRRQPAFAVIYLGIGDHATIPPELFSSNMQRIIQMLIDNGVVPLVFTYPMADIYNVEGTPGLYNDIVRNVALQYNLPLIDLRAATWDMNNRGVGHDGYHLSQQSIPYSDIDTERQLYGRTMREHLTLEALHQIFQVIGF
jgi:uncharacterized protein YgiM (DUF1202 family)